MTDSLVLELLGPVCVAVGAEIALPTRKSLALLAHVAVAGPTSRSRLANLLWSNQTEEAARRNLRQELHRIHATRAGEWVEMKGDGIGLARGADVDVTRLRAAVAAREFGEATRLYRGPLLAQFEIRGASEFMDWLGVEREALSRLWREAALAESGRREAMGDLQGALELVRALLAEDPLAEACHREAMRLLHLLGERSAALAQFEQCRARLRADLALEPLPETVSLAHYIRATFDESASPATEAGPPDLRPPLVGREAAWALLSGGGDRLALIMGEPGVGKTRLAHDFAQSNGTLLVLKGREISRDTPFYPVAEALLEAYRADSTWFELLDPVWRTEVGHLVPMLAEDEVRSELPAAEARGRLLEGLAAAIITAARGGAVLFDDMHWFDSASAELVAHVARRAGRVRLLASARSDDIARNAAVQSAISAVERDGLLLRIPIDALTETDVLRLVRAMSGSTTANVFSQRLHAATAGNPLFILETLRDLFGAGVLWREEGTWATPFDGKTSDYRELPISSSVREAVLRRIDRLGEGVRRLLEAASLAGDRFTLEAIGSSTALSEGEAVDAADRAVRAALIAEFAEGHRFTHDLIRRSLEDSLSAERRKLLHRRLAGALAASGASHASDIARHLEAGGRPAEAIAYRIRAAEAAIRTYAHPEALAQYECALADGPVAAEAFRIHGARCEIFRNLGDDESRSDALETMAALAAGQDDPEMLVELARKQSVNHFEHDRYYSALATVEGALRRLSGRIDATSEATLLLELGATLKALGRLDEAEARLLAALEAFRDVSAIKYANAAYWLCQCALERGDLPSAGRYCDVSLEATGRCGYRRGHALSLSVSADLAFRGGDIDTGIARLAEAHGEAREIGSLPLQREFLEALVERLRQAGRTDEATVRRAELAALHRD